MKNFVTNFLVLGLVVLTLHVRSQGNGLSKIGCNHPFQEGVSSLTKMVELLEKEAVRNKTTILVTTIKDTTILESGRFVIGKEYFLRMYVRFYKEKALEISYNYELSSSKDKDSLCNSWLQIFREQKNNFTEVINDRAYHNDVNSFWNFFSNCTSNTGLLAVIVETLKKETPTVSITYLY